MNPSKATDNWTIYNCHIHTFTSKHSPRWFIKWAFSDAELGKFNWFSAILYLILAYLYIRFLSLLAEWSTELAQSSDFWPLLGYSIVVFLQAALVIPIAVLVTLLLFLGGIYGLEKLIDLLLAMRDVSQSRRMDRQLTKLKNQAVEGRQRIIRSNLLVKLLVRINPASNDAFERLARFLKIAEQPTQQDVFEEVQRQYPEDTVFVVLPMDMGFMNLGRPAEPIERQHAELLALAQAYPGRIIPFYAADPRHPDIVERARENLARDKFQGIKIYPNLGYKPDDPNLMEIYKLCIKGNFPVLTHCSPGGIWRYGVPKKQRRENSRPLNYKNILETRGYRNLKLCLAHFGGAEEWARHLRGRAHQEEEEAWVRTIYEMIASGDYPNLYADISYTVFTPRVPGLYMDLVDYLKVLLNDPLVRRRVLFGSDYYMVERESVSEKEVSLLLRSRLGEDLYRQIAYTNPREFLGIETPQRKRTVTKKRRVARQR